MTGERAAGQTIQIPTAPAELMNCGAQRQRAVDASTRDHDICTRRERRGDRLGAEISVEAEQPLRHRGAGEHFAPTLWAPLRCTIQKIITNHHADLKLYADCGEALFEGARAGARIYTAGIGDDLDVLVDELHGVTADRVNEIRREAGLRFSGARPRHDRHSDLRPVINSDVAEGRGQ